MLSQKQIADLLRRCYDEYRLKLFSFCLARLSGERGSADDCVQEAFLVLHQKLLDGEEIENPRAFLYRTAENFVRRRQEQISKENKRNLPLEDAYETASSEDIYFDIVEQIDYEELARQLIENLDDNEKTIYSMRYMKKMRVDEIATELNISRPAASMRLMRLKTKITDMVMQLDFEKGAG